MNGSMQHELMHMTQCANLMIGKCECSSTATMPGCNCWSVDRLSGILHSQLLHAHCVVHHPEQAVAMYPLW